MAIGFCNHIKVGEFRIKLDRSKIEYSRIRLFSYNKKKKNSSEKRNKDSINRFADKKDTYDCEENEADNRVVPSSISQFIEKLNKVNKKNTLLLIIQAICGLAAFFGALLVYSWLFGEGSLAAGIVGLVLFVGGLIAVFLIPQKAVVEVDYQFEDRGWNSAYEKMLSTMEQLQNSNGAWIIEG